MSSYYNSFSATTVYVVISKAWLSERGFSSTALSSSSVMTERSILQVKDSSKSNKLIRLKPTSVNVNYTTTSIQLIFNSVPLFSGISTLTAMFEDSVDVDNSYTETYIYKSVTVTKIEENYTASTSENRGIITTTGGNIFASVPSKLIGPTVTIDNIKFKVTGSFSHGTASLYLPSINMYSSGNYTYITSNYPSIGYAYNSVYNYEVIVSNLTDLDGATITDLSKVGSGSFRVVELNTTIEIKD